MKKIHYILLPFLTLFISSISQNSIFAYNNINEEPGAIVYPNPTYNYCEYEIVNNEVTITLCHREIDAVPDIIEGYPVTKIGERSFCAVEFNKNLLIPDTVREIEDYAFAVEVGSGVRDITIPKSVQTIGSLAIGYKLAIDTPHIKSYEPIEDVVIRGYKGTAAETYALRNRFTFIALDEESITTTAPVTTGTTTETTVVTTQTTTVSNTETTPVTTTPDITENIKGDANGDGKLAASDAAFIARKLAEASINSEKITVEKYPAADFNGDGKVTAKDAADIASYLAKHSIIVNKKIYS